ncbi:MAG: chemotaxis protein CheA [Deltaproteobacteria bacterium]|nr:chemotaxis protein CheA [Deltaproteobacteria bacterium]
MVKDNDSDDKALDEFISEAEEIIEKLNSDLLVLGSEKENAHPDTLNSIFRSAHTLKGLAGMFGLTSLTEVSHNMENLLDSLRLGKVSVTDRILDVLFECIEIITELVKGNEEALTSAGKIEGLLSTLEKAMNKELELQRHSPIDSLNIDPTILAVLTEYEEHRLLEGIKSGKNIYLIHASFSMDSFDKGLGDINASIRDHGEVISTLPSATGGEEGGIQFDLLFSSQKSSHFIESKIDKSDVSMTIVSGDGTDREEAAKEEVKKEERGIETTSVKAISRTVRVDISKMDLLMNIIGELLITKNSMVSIADEMKGLPGYHMLAKSLDRSNRELNRKLAELQEGMMEIRMVSLGNLFDRLAMTVRKIARSNNKEVDLIIKGADTKLDKLIVEEIGDPLMHIIRNAVDHGVEPPELRREAGKPEKGTVRLSAFQRGNNVMMEIEDDGAGIDKEKILRKAKQKGLVSESKEVSDDEILELIFTPGFSTSSEISEISGRGVGMDVVKNNLTRLSGHIDIESEKGHGTLNRITLPITLAIIQALIVETASRTYAIPLNSIQESLLVNKKEIETVEKKEVIQNRNATLPLVRLEEIFDLPAREKKKANDLYVVVAAIAQHRFGMVVDKLVGEQDIVIKPIGDVFSGIKGIAGATDLGNNKTVLVLDVASIVEELTGV